MAFSYDRDDLETPLNALRFLVQDTDETDFLLHDSEIIYTHGSTTNIYRTAATLCRVIAASKAKDAEIKDENLKIAAEAAAREYRLLANDMDKKADALDESADSGSGGGDAGGFNFPTLPDNCPVFKRTLHLD